MREVYCSMCLVSILITSYQRPHLLKWNLASLAKQNIPCNFETIVLNDGLPDATEAVCRNYEKCLHLRYVFTGQRNLSGTMRYRVPGFAINIGARLARGKILIISCAEMYHLNNTIGLLMVPPFLNSKNIGASIGMDDDGSFLAGLEKHGEYDFGAYSTRYPRLNSSLPFLMAIHRDEFFAIGGYDEDFTGNAYDDNDLVDRLLANGCRLILTQAMTIHLYHRRHYDETTDRTNYLYNERLYRERRGQIVRNMGREWGKLEN